MPVKICLGYRVCSGPAWVHPDSGKNRRAEDRVEMMLHVVLASHPGY